MRKNLKKALSITSAGVTEFVKSFSEIQSLRNEKEINVFMEKREKQSALMPPIMMKAHYLPNTEFYYLEVFEISTNGHTF